MNEIEIICKRGKARVKVCSTGLKLLTGARRKWDDFHWSFYSDSSEIALQGLWRGRYADAVASTENVLKALVAVGGSRVAEGIIRAGWQDGDTLPPELVAIMATVV